MTDADLQIDNDQVRELHLCSRSACRAIGADHYHKHLRRWYCARCAYDINRLCANDGHGTLLHKGKPTVLISTRRFGMDLFVLRFDFDQDVEPFYELAFPREARAGLTTDTAEEMLKKLGSFIYHE